MSAYPQAATVQVLQDGGWWRAAFIGPFSEPAAPPFGAPPVPDFVKAASANAPAQMWLVQILERPEPAIVLRVGASRLRPDWGWTRAGWALAQPRGATIDEDDPARPANVIVALKSPRPDLMLMCDDAEAAADSDDAGGVSEHDEEKVVTNVDMAAIIEAAGDAASAETSAGAGSSTDPLPSSANGANRGVGSWFFRSGMLPAPMRGFLAGIVSAQLRALSARHPSRPPRRLAARVSRAEAGTRYTDAAIIAVPHGRSGSA